MNNIFVLPYSKKQYIVYLPFQGIIFKGNTAAVNLFYKALKGDKKALSGFGISEKQAALISGQKGQSILPAGREIRFEPVSVSLFLTSDCSMRCVYCYASAGERHYRIRMEHIEAAAQEIIKNALRLKKNHITVSYHGGGDIGVVWDITEEATGYIYDLAKRNSISVFFNVGINGILTDYQRKWIVENTQSATVSIDGFSDIQNALRPLKNGNPSFEIVDNTLKYFDAQGYNYSIRSTITSETVSQLDKIITFFCRNYKARKIKVEPVYEQGRASHEGVKSPKAEDFVKYYLKAQKAASGYDRELLYSGARFDVLSDIFCLAAGSSFGVTPEGYITSCYEVLEKSNPLSDIFFYGRIEGGKIKISRDKLKNLTKLTVGEKEKCLNCFARLHCAGDCPAKAFLAENSDTYRDYRCIINRALTRDQLLKSIR